MSRDRPRVGLTGRVLVVLALATVTPTMAAGWLAIRRARADLETEAGRGNLALIRALGAAVVAANSCNASRITSLLLAPRSRARRRSSASVFASNLTLVGMTRLRNTEA